MIENAALPTRTIGDGDDDDATLLGEFARTRSPDTFRRLVDRYVNMVHAAARRQVRDPHLAEDVTQAVFLLLSQRASTVSGQRAVGGWLLLTTRNVARNAMKREWRLKRREHEAAKMNSETDMASSPQAAAIAPMLDDALAKLAAADRDAIVARFFHGGSHRDVGQELGVSEEAATKRVSRALDKLRAILERQGITASEASLSALLPVIALKPAASVALVSSVVGTASAAAPPAAVAALAKGAAAGATMKGTTIAVGAGIIAMFAAGAVITVTTMMHKPPAPQAASPLAVNPAPAVPIRPAIAAAPVGRTVTLSMIDPKTTAPVADVQVQLEVDNNKRTPARADANGKFVLNLPATYQYARAICSAPGRVQMSIEFPNQTFKGQLLSDYTVPMETGTKIGGIVLDEAGEPVIGATVTLYSIIRGAMDEPRPILLGEKFSTGVDGRWSFDNGPSDVSLISISVSHPDYPKNQPYPDAPKEALRRGEYKTELKWHVGRALDGFVLDSGGNPITGATLIVASDRYESNKPKTVSDAAGKFHLTGIGENWRTYVTATAPGFAPQQVELPGADPAAKTTEAYKPIEVRMDKGVKLEATVVDASGKPVNGAKVDVERWRGNRALSWSTKTDRQGHFVWANAPTDAIQFNVSKKNFASLSGVEVTAGGAEPIKLTMVPPLRITGNVIDAETKQPVPAFRVIEGIRWTGQDEVTWQSQSARSLSNGKYEADITDFSNGGRLRVEADGYLPADSRMIQSNEGAITLDFELKKGSGPSGQVVDADGRPVMDVRVIGLADGTSRYLDWESGNIDEQNLPISHTDKDGRYRLQPMPSHYALMAVGAPGFVMLKQEEIPKDGTLKLLKWARIEGDLRLNASPLASATVAVQAGDIAGGNYSVASPQSTTDAAGHFIVEHVAPNQEVMLQQLVPMGRGSSRYRTIGTYRTTAGQTVNVRAGGKGRPVIGKILPPPGLKGDVNWPQQLTFEPAHPVQNAAMALLRKLSSTTKPNNDERGLDLIQTSSGSMRADEVEPGSYQVRAVLRESWERSRNPAILGTAMIDVTVPATPACPTDEPLDIGTVQLEAP